MDYEEKKISENVDENIEVFSGKIQQEILNNSPLIVNEGLPVPED